jgi:hypothetical protein
VIEDSKDFASGRMICTRQQLDKLHHDAGNILFQNAVFIKFLHAMACGKIEK